MTTDPNTTPLFVGFIPGTLTPEQNQQLREFARGFGVQFVPGCDMQDVPFCGWGDALRDERRAAMATWFRHLWIDSATNTGGVAEHSPAPSRLTDAEQAVIDAACDLIDSYSSLFINRSGNDLLRRLADAVDNLKKAP